MPETEQEKLNRIGNVIYLVIVGTLVMVGVLVILFAALGSA